MEEVDELVYAGWFDEVAELLTDREALTLIKGNSEVTLRAWFLQNRKPKDVADNLNRRLSTYRAMTNSKPRPKRDYSRANVGPSAGRNNQLQGQRKHNPRSEGRSDESNSFLG